MTPEKAESELDDCRKNVRLVKHMVRARVVQRAALARERTEQRRRDRVEPAPSSLPTDTHTKTLARAPTVV